MTRVILPRDKLLVTAGQSVDLAAREAKQA